MTGDTCPYFCPWLPPRRLGINDTPVTKNTGEEVNDYLARAIDARSTDRLRSQHCRPLLLAFKKAQVEEKVIVLLIVDYGKFDIFFQFFFS